MRQFATVAAADTFTAPFTPAGAFLVMVTGTVGSNKVRVQFRDLSGTWINATDGSNGAIQFTAAGTYVIDNPTTGVEYRVGTPAADWVSGSFGVEVDFK